MKTLKLKSYDLSKYFLKILPYFASLLAGSLFILITINLNTENEIIRDLFISISATFFVIPLIFLFYQTAQNYSEKRLNKEIFDYAKIQVDKEIFSIMNQLTKMLGGDNLPTFENISKSILLSKSEIERNLSDNKFLGFKIYKNWDTMNLHEILKNPYILERLENDHIICIINLIKSLEILSRLQKKDDLYINTGENEPKFYKIMPGNNSELPNRYILLKSADDITKKKNTFIVLDFGDFDKFNLEKLLKYFTINEKYVKEYTDIIFILSTEVNRWIQLTGNEIIINPNEVRIRSIK